MTEPGQKMMRAIALKNLSLHTQCAYPGAFTGPAEHYRPPPAASTQETIEYY